MGDGARAKGDKARQQRRVGDRPSTRDGQIYAGVEARAGGPVNDPPGFETEAEKKKGVGPDASFDEGNLNQSCAIQQGGPGLKFLYEQTLGHRAFKTRDCAKGRPAFETVGQKNARQKIQTSDGGGQAVPDALVQNVRKNFGAIPGGPIPGRKKV